MTTRPESFSLGTTYCLQFKAAFEKERANQRTSKVEPRLKLFHNLPLDPTRPLIRVIEIVPNDQNDPLRCKMSIVTLDEPYVALSYVWGKDNAAEQVIVEGESLTVRQNLLLFLKPTRDKIRSGNLQLGPIFIDALCIDQSNVTERNHQVRQMGQVYRNARRVYSWLGAGLPHVETLFTALADMVIYRDRKPWPHKVMEERLLDLIGMNDKILIEIGDLDYWKRLWIVPEVCLANDLVFLYGSQQVNALEFFKLFIDIKRYAHFHRASRHKSNPYDAPWLRLAVERWIQIIDAIALNDFLVCFKPSNNPAGVQLPVSKNQKLTDLFDIYGLKECSDCRDRLFALLAMSDDRRRHLVDYRESPLSLFLKMVAVDEGDVFPHIKRLSQMLRLHSMSPEIQAFDKAGGAIFEIKFSGFPLFDAWNHYSLRLEEIPRLRPIFLADSFRAGWMSGATILICRPTSKKRIEILLMPREYAQDWEIKQDYEIIGVISGGDVDLTKWLHNRCTMVTVSKEESTHSEPLQAYRTYRLITSSLVALLEFLEAIDVNPRMVKDQGYIFPQQYRGLERWDEC